MVYFTTLVASCLVVLTLGAITDKDATHAKEDLMRQLHHPMVDMALDHGEAATGAQLASSSYGCTCPFQVWDGKDTCTGSSDATMTMPLAFGQCDTMKNSTGNFASQLSNDCSKMSIWKGTSCSGTAAQTISMTDGHCMTSVPGGGITGSSGAVTGKCQTQPSTTQVNPGKTCRCVSKTYSDSSCTNEINSGESFMVADGCITVSTQGISISMAVDGDCKKLGVWTSGGCPGSAYKSVPVTSSECRASTTGSAKLQCFHGNGATKAVTSLLGMVLVGLVTMIVA